ncbi:MAG: DUF4783 domain-containing protein [Bacteroidetes bacterium]|jgi:hypothetical protein|nr:DUF4783 domain-containing protein [Bacteroidota bacterium]
MKSLITILSLFLLSVNIASAELDLLDDIANALRSGDAKSVSKYFGNSVDLTIITQEEVYSKVQAEQVLRDFFSKNQPRSFTIIHKGESKEGARYAIGSLITTQGVSYRTYFYIKQQGGNAIIQELRFMKE